MKSNVKNFTKMLSTKRLKDGRYEVHLPFINHKIGNPSNLFGKSRDIAVARLIQIERRFQKDSNLKNMYVDCMQEYIKLHMVKEISSEANKSTISINPTYSCSYLPHHAVQKETSSTTKLRVVFDASCKTSNGVSLNNKLLPGPVLQDELIILLRRWREHSIVFNADIEKMYRQIRVNQSHSL